MSFFVAGFGRAGVESYIFKLRKVQYSIQPCNNIRLCFENCAENCFPNRNTTHSLLDLLVL